MVILSDYPKKLVNATDISISEFSGIYPSSMVSV